MSTFRALDNDRSTPFVDLARGAPILQEPLYTYLDANGAWQTVLPVKALAVSSPAQFGNAVKLSTDDILLDEFNTTTPTGAELIVENDTLAFGTGDFTIEVSIYVDMDTMRRMTGTSGGTLAIAVGVSITAYLQHIRPIPDDYFWLLFNLGTKQFTFSGNPNYEATGFSGGGWTQLVYQRVAGMGYLFQHGELISRNKTTKAIEPFPDTTNYRSSLAVFGDGSLAIRWANGGFAVTEPYSYYLDELRVTRGVGRYPTVPKNGLYAPWFTPPAAPFPTGADDPHWSLVTFASHLEDPSVTAAVAAAGATFGGADTTPPVSPGSMAAPAEVTYVPRTIAADTSPAAAETVTALVVAPERARALMSKIPAGAYNLAAHLNAPNVPYATAASLTAQGIAIVRKTPYKALLLRADSLTLESGGIWLGASHNTGSDDSTVQTLGLTTARHKAAHVALLTTGTTTSYNFRVKDRATTPPVPADTLAAEQAAYEGRRAMLALFPASLWSGKMRLLMQAKYGSAKHWDMSMQADSQGSLTPTWTVRKTGDPTFNYPMAIAPGAGVVGPFHGRYWLVTLTGGTVWAAELTVPAVAALGKTPGPGVEAAVLQTAYPSWRDTGVFVRLGSFAMTGAPLAYDWKFNDAGTEASVVSVKTNYTPDGMGGWKPDYYDSALYTVNFYCTSATDPLTYTARQVTSGSFLTGSSAHSIWVPSPTSGLDFWWTAPSANTIGLTSWTVPLYCCYDGADLRVISFTSTVGTANGTSATRAADIDALNKANATPPGVEGFASFDYSDDIGIDVQQGIFCGAMPSSYNTSSYGETHSVVVVEGATVADVVSDSGGNLWPSPLAPTISQRGASGSVFYSALATTCEAGYQTATSNTARSYATYLAIPPNECNVAFTGSLYQEAVTTSDTGLSFSYANGASSLPLTLLRAFYSATYPPPAVQPWVGWLLWSAYPQGDAWAHSFSFPGADAPGVTETPAQVTATVTVVSMVSVFGATGSHASKAARDPSSPYYNGDWTPAKSHIEPNLIARVSAVEGSAFYTWNDALTDWPLATASGYTYNPAHPAVIPGFIGMA